jgi:outer membrane protein
VGTQLTIPIFNGFRIKQRITAAEIQSEKSKLVIEQEKQELEKQVSLEK